MRSSFSGVFQNLARVTIDQIYDIAPDAKWMGDGYLLMRCPFHDDAKASLLVYKDGWSHCRGECLASYPLDTLYAELSSPGSVNRASPDITYGKPPRLPGSPAGLTEFVDQAHETIMRNNSFSWYVEERGLGGRVEPCYLGWHQGWLVLPVFSEHRELDGVILRSGPQEQQLTGLRFSQPTGQRSMVYCPDWSLLHRTEGPLYVVFGMMDALTLSELRLPVVTSTGGAQSFQKQWLEDYRKPIIVVPDAGEQRAATLLANGLDWRGKLKMLSYPGDFKDPNDYMVAGKGQDLLRELVGA